MHRFAQDIRFAIRGLIKAPLFTLGVVATLGLGIGINATMFGVVDALYLRPPSGVANPDGVVRVNFHQVFGGALGSFTGPTTAFPTFTDLREHVGAFERVAAVSNQTLGLGRGAAATQVSAAAVSWDYFPLLGLRPALGRFFTDAEDRVGGARVAVLSYGFWKAHFGGDSSVIGRALPIGKGTYTVIGIGPARFSGIDLKPTDIYLPIRPAAEGDVTSPEAITSYNYMWMQSIARLKPGATPAAAIAQATLAYRNGKSQGRRSRDTTSQAVLSPLQLARGPNTSSDAKVALWIALVSLVVLLIACANVANLLLARGVSRRRELAVRASLGAGRAGLMRILLSESFVLALAGGAVAVGLAFWTGAAARSFLLPELAPDTPLVEPRVLAFTGIAILLTTVLTGIVPAIQASRTDLNAALKNGERGSTGHGSVTRTALLVAQVALTLVLLVGAGLFVRSLRKVQGIDLGMDIDRVYSVSIGLSGAGFDRVAANDIYLRLIDRFGRIRGVESAAGSQGTPFGYSWAEGVRAEGADSIPEVKSGGPYFLAVTPGFLATLGTRIVTGRDFDTGDRANGAPVAIVGANFARRVWPRTSAVGRCLYIGDDTTTVCTRVIGVAADATQRSIVDKDALIYYVPFAQRKDATVNGLVVRSRSGANGVAAALQREVQAEGNLPFANIQRMSDQVAPQMRAWRLGASAFTAFGLLALLIAATGVFAVLSYGVSQRTREIGVRVALGAQSGHVVGLVVGQGIRAALLGTVLGAVGAYGLGRAMASLLYQVPPGDPAVFASVSAILLSVAAVAAYLPARRASRVAPMIALRSE